jgi:hypothetical protein
VINKMVLIYAVPLPLSAGTVTQVTADLGLAAAIGVAMLRLPADLPERSQPHPPTSGLEIRAQTARPDSSSATQPPDGID